MSRLDESVDNASFILEDANDFDDELDRMHSHFKQIVTGIKKVIDQQSNAEKQ